MNKMIRMLMLTALVALVVTGCACNNGTTASPSPKPSAMTATPMPSPSASESATPSDAGGAQESAMPSASPEASDAPGSMAVDTAKLIAELEKLSEVDTADVVTEGNRAIIGLNFDAQYQGTLTERIEEMAVEAVSRIESALTDVAVTADPTLVTEIKTIAQESSGQSLSEEQKQKFDELYRKIKPGDAQDSANS